MRGHGSEDRTPIGASGIQNFLLFLSKQLKFERQLSCLKMEDDPNFFLEGLPPQQYSNQKQFKLKRIIYQK